MDHRTEKGVGVVVKVGEEGVDWRGVEGETNAAGFEVSATWLRYCQCLDGVSCLRDRALSVTDESGTMENAAN